MYVFHSFMAPVTIFDVNAATSLSPGAWAVSSLPQGPEPTLLTQLWKHWTRSGAFAES